MDVFNEWIQAATDNDPKTLHHLLATHPGLLNQRHSEFERTALQLAVAWDASHAVEFLLNHGASVDITDPDGQTAIHIAAAVDALRSLSLLIEHCVQRLKTPSTANHPESQIHSPHHRMSLRIPIVNQRDRYGYTALHLSAANGSMECTHFLLTRGGADPTLALPVAPFVTALDLALQGHHHDIAALLKGNI